MQVLVTVQALRTYRYKVLRFAGDKDLTTIPKTELYRLLPSVDDLLRADELKPLLARAGQPVVAEAVRAVLAQVREEVSAGHLRTPDSVQLAIAGLAGA